VGYREDALAKWRDWDERIWTDIKALLWRREIWTGLVEQLDRRGMPDSGYFKVAWVRMYVESLSAAIRRHAVVDPDSVSLARLIADLERQSAVFTRDLYMTEVWDMSRVEDDEQWVRDAWRTNGTEGFDLWAGPGGVHVDPERMSTDLAALHDTTDKVVHFVNRTIAHLDRRGFDTGLTFGELHAGLDAVKELHGKYHTLLTGRLIAVDPVIQGDWKAPFRVALFGPTD
jgi:hypothetical protein